MRYILYPIFVSLVFLVVNVLILLAILAMNRRTGARSKQRATPASVSSDHKQLKASDILRLEFEYARTTASEAMQDRHTMINFYLVISGVIASGVIAVLGQDVAPSKVPGTLLLWLLCSIGWLYFLKLIRLRQAWRDSAQTMNRIKDFYIQHAVEFEPEVLRGAFRWRTETLPPPGQPWSVYFYSAMLIGSLNSAAYMAGGALLDLDATKSSWLALGLLTLLGLVFFAFHIWLYFAFLKPEPWEERNP